MHGGQRWVHVIHARHVVESDHDDVLRNPKPMLMQRAHDADGLIVVRGDDRGGQRRASTPILINEMIHVRICLRGIPRMAAHDL